MKITINRRYISTFLHNRVKAIANIKQITNKRAILVICALTLLNSACGANTEQHVQNKAQPALQDGVQKNTEATPPNIVFILADDLGISDINAYARYFSGKTNAQLYYETPNLDRLAKKGISFSQAYANPLCSPTRAAILTGINPAKLGFTTAVPARKTYFNQQLTPPNGHNIHDVLAHKDRIKTQQAWNNATTNTGINPKLDILPEVLTSHHSAFIGKWHVGGIGVKALQPGPQGFDEVLASFDAGASKYFNDQSTNGKPSAYSWPSGWNSATPRYDSMPAGSFDVGTAGGAPYADYLTDDLTNKAVAFIKRRVADKSANKKPFFLYFSHFAVHTPLQAPKTLVDYYQQKPQRGTLGHNHPVYAGMISRLDDSVGRILDTIEQLDIDENTLIIFTSDNGGTEYTRQPATDNHPFKGGKATMYEGGIRVPLIFYMANRFSDNIWRHQVVSAVDFMPTLAQLTNNPLPKNLDGQSLIPLLQQPQAKLKPRSIFWHYPFNVIVSHPDHQLPLTPTSGIRRGNYKLLWDWHGKLELYDVQNDPFEKHDLAKQNPVLTQALFDELHQWLLTQVEPQYMPKRNKNYDANKDQRPYPFKDLSGALTQPRQL